MFSESIILSTIDIIIYLIGLYTLHKVLDKDTNLGFHIRNSAYILGYTIAMCSVFLSGDFEKTLLTYPLYSLIDTTIILILLLISIKINNKLILRKLDNDVLIKEGNISIPIIEAGTILATSVIIFSSMYGEGKYINGFIFFILGQISLIAMVKFYEGFTKFDDMELIKNNNISIALVLFSIVIGFSLIVGTSVFGESSEAGIIEDIIAFAYLFIFSIVFLIIFLNKLLDKVFFPKCTINEEIQKDNIKIILPYSIIKLSIIIIIAIII